jgi:hypothetical protein
VNTSDIEDGRVVTIQTLSNAQLFQILQLDDCDDELTRMVEERLKLDVAIFDFEFSTGTELN